MVEKNVYIIMYMYIVCIYLLLNGLLLMKLQIAKEHITNRNGVNTIHFFNDKIYQIYMTDINIDVWRTF